MKDIEFEIYAYNIIKIHRLLYRSKHDHESIKILMERVPVYVLENGVHSTNTLAGACYSECLDCVKLFINYGMNISKALQCLNDSFVPPHDIETLKTYQYLCQLESLQGTIPFLVGLRQATGILPTFTKHSIYTKDPLVHVLRLITGYYEPKRKRVKGLDYKEE